MVPPTESSSIVTGRFAPSPTGPLHYGSLLAALASFADSRNQGGRWLVRMEDLDPPREMPGAADDILRTLERYQLYWDGEVMYQSQRTAAYEAALQQIAQLGLSYPCTCTRRELRQRGETVYRGHCRQGCRTDREQHSIRIRVPAEEIRYRDLIQGRQCWRLDEQAGDFIIHRADGLYAYQLAVVVDDAQQGITDIIRGADLLDSTPQQLYLQQVLGLPSPRYGHIPVAVNASGEKLSKQTGAQAVNEMPAAATLTRALADLGQSPPTALARAAPREIVEWAVANWRRDQIPARSTIAAQ